MTPTLHQTQILKKFLDNTLDYRETKEELYDHIATALENDQTGVPFQDAVNNILETDFCGAKGLVKIEAKYFRSVMNEVIGQQWRNFKWSFEFPRILCSMLILGCIYYSLLKFDTQLYFTFGKLTVAVYITPAVFVIFSLCKIGYLFKRPKQSVKDGILSWVAVAPSLILLAMCIIRPYRWLAHHPLMMSLLLLALALYFVAFVKLCSQDFKAFKYHETNFTAN